MSEKIKILLGQLDIEIISYWTEQNRLVFLLCLHSNGNLFFLNLKGFNLTIDESTLDSKKRYYIQRLQTQYTESSILESIYQQFQSILPQYINKIIYHIDDYIMINTNTIYKVIQKSLFTNSHIILPKFDLDYIIENKFRYEENMLIFFDDLYRKAEKLATENYEIENLSLPNVNTSNLKESMSIIQVESEELTKLQSLFYSMVNFQNQTNNTIKKLEDYTGVKTLHDSKMQMKEKNITKNRLKNLLKLKQNTIENLVSSTIDLNNKLTLSIYYKKEFSKLYLSLENLMITFNKKYTVNS